MSFPPQGGAHRPSWLLDYHLPILTELKLAHEKFTNEKRPKWKLNKEKWKNWQNNITEDNTIHESSEELNNAFTKSLQNAAKITFGKTSQESKVKYCKPWWTNECARAIARRRRARRAMERRPTISNIIEYKRCIAKAKSRVVSEI